MAGSIFLTTDDVAANRYYAVRDRFAGGVHLRFGTRRVGAIAQVSFPYTAAELVLDTHHSLQAAAGLYASSGFVAIEPYNDNPNATRWYAKRL